MAEQVIEAFGALSLDYKLEEHQKAFTVDEQSQFVGHLPGTLTKNLFLKDKKHGLFLVTVSSDRVVDTKLLGKKMNMGKMNLRFASEDVLMEKLRVAQGSVTPLAVMNDTAGDVTLVLDQALIDTDLINCHPLQNDKTVSLTPDALLAFVRHYNHEPVVIDFSASVAVAQATNSPKAKKAKQPAVKLEKDTKSKEGVSYPKSQFAEWYTETITKSGMIDYYDISGCYILRPWSYAIWEYIQQFLDTSFKGLGVQNCYFPMFVSNEKLTKEEEHLEGFAPEVAWVTKYGSSDLKEPIAIRPTSETIMYPAFKNWIRSHRDLPLKLNQWNNVVRWEFRNPTPFIRTREFLWQEGHTAHATKEEADAEVHQILDFYSRAYEELLAVPMIKGIKTEKEKFAGAAYTTTIEGYIPATGRGIQAATSHQLGQNFGKMFNIVAEGDRGEKIIPYQNSWGFTTRSIGVMIMVHGDDKGLVLPPRISPVQAVIVPIPFKKNEDLIYDKATVVEKILRDAGVRVEVDQRRIYTPGWKYNHWELKGVPLRFELGPRDVEKEQVRVVRRDNAEKLDIAWADLADRIPKLLQQIQTEMLQRATKERDERIRKVDRWDQFVPTLQDGCMALTPFCNETEWEENVKNKSREESLELSGQEEEAENAATSVAAKTLCMPFEENKLPIPPGTKCFVSGKDATCYVLWGRSY